MDSSMIPRWSIFPREGFLRLIPALIAEFVGVMLFQLLGSQSDPDFDASGAFINGISLMALVYATATVSGGHLNPAVSFMAFALGEQPLVETFLYNAVQYTGAIVGSAFTLALVPGATAGSGTGPGCFRPKLGQVSHSMIFGWESILTGMLAFVVASTAMSKKGMGKLAPLAIGFTLFVSASAIGQFTGSFLNPARVVGPVAIYKCSNAFTEVDTPSRLKAWVYILGEYFGALMGGLLFLATHKYRDFLESRAASKETTGENGEQGAAAEAAACKEVAVRILEVPFDVIDLDVGPE